MANTLLFFQCFCVGMCGGKCFRWYFLQEHLDEYDRNFFWGWWGALAITFLAVPTVVQFPVEIGLATWNLLVACILLWVYRKLDPFPTNPDHDHAE